MKEKPYPADSSDDVSDDPSYLDNVELHYKRFLSVVKKYSLSDDRKAEEISEFLTHKTQVSGDKVSPKQFAEHFGMSEHEALIFLTFLERGLDFMKKLIS